MLSGFFYLNRLKKEGLIKPTVEWQHRFEQLRQQMGIRIPVQFSISKLVKEPLTFYFFRPIVLAPMGIFTGLTTDQIEVLLLHELAHIRRFDFVINIFQSLIEILFFYHPLAWWISKKIRDEREHCCDDLVIQIRNNPLLYAEALTQVQLHQLSFKTQLAMSINGNNNGSFSKRIFRLFGRYEQKPSVMKGALMAGLLMIGLLTQSFYTPSTHLTEMDEVQKENTLTESTETSSSVYIPTEVSTTSTEVKPDIPVRKKVSAVSRLESKQVEVEGKTLFGKLPVTQLTIPVIKKVKADPVEAIVDEENEEKTSTTLPVPSSEDISVSIDWTNEVNRNHMGYEVFHKWGPKKIKEMYLQNKQLQEVHEKLGEPKPDGLVTDKDEYNSLIYTVTENNQTRLDTLQNRVTPDNSFLGFKKGYGKAKKNLKGYKSGGRLPKGTVSSVGVNGKSEVDVSIGLMNKPCDVRIEVLSADREVVATLVNEKLDKGNYEYKWNEGSTKAKGNYYIKFVVDGQTRSQRIKVKR